MYQLLPKDVPHVALTGDRTAGPDGVLEWKDGRYEVHEYRTHLAGRAWSILHTGALLSLSEEVTFMTGAAPRRPYGVILWPAAIALAHELASRAATIRGTSMLELGSGTGLPGLVAASLGATVLQTDRHELALSVCRRNCERNGITGVEHRIADWTAWSNHADYDVILGSDILYATKAHEHLSKIFSTNLRPSGRILLSDPFRRASIPLLDSLEQQGWDISLNKWTIGEDAEPRPIAVYQLTRGSGWRSPA